MKTLVTGANGHVGSAVVRKLLGRGREVRALVRPSSNLAGLLDRGEVPAGLEMVQGDLLDPESLGGALRQVDMVYQVAGVFQTRLDDESGMVRTNTEGACNVLRACAKAKVRKVVFTSSVAAIGCSRSPETILDENIWNDDPIDAYVASKAEGERQALDLAGELGLAVVFVNPGTVLGPGDHKPTPSNDFIRLYMKSAPPVYFDSGHSYTHVDDVAEGHLLAEERGEPGRRYILAGDNVSNKELFEKIARLTGGRQPWLKVGHTFVSVVGLGAETLAKIRRRPALFTRAKAHKLIDYYGYFSSARARRDLGYRWRPIDVILEDCEAWFKKKGWI